ncbi:MAG: 3-phosphoshikimate 1-carboxyvinyltransferase [Verrucomicrobiota bacterium]
MVDPLPIQPITAPLDHTVHLPGSKSITNRALILAALSEGTTELQGALFSRDTNLMISALKQLGFECETNETTQTIAITGCAGKIPNKNATIEVGNAGTVARFLTAFLSIQAEGRYEIDGDSAMRKRPMLGLTSALETMHAAQFEFHEKTGHFPFTLYSKGIQGGQIQVDASASSQILSALLMAAVAGKKDTELICPNVRPSYVQITLDMMESFGSGRIETNNGIYKINPARYTSPNRGIYAIEPDLSAASYFLALNLILGGSLHIPNLGSSPLQGDARFVEVLAHHGLRVEPSNNSWKACQPDPTSIQKGHREINFNTFSDTFLTYAAIAPLLGNSVRICGIGHTRHQETDRIAGMANELSKLGQLVKEEEDTLTIQAKPNELRARTHRARNEGKLIEIETYDDHRFAMSFAILGSYDLFEDGKPWLAIKNPSCCGKTFPKFFDELASLHPE